MTQTENLVDGGVEDILIGLTKPSMDRLLKMDSPSDCIALYTLYCYVRKWQKNSNVRATSEFVMKGLDMGRDRFSRAKKQLLDAGFIEDIISTGAEGKIEGHYVKVRFVLSHPTENSSVENHPTENPQGGKPRYKYPLLVTEIPLNGNTPSNNQKEEEQKPTTPSMTTIQKAPPKPSEASPDGFDEFWAAYPRRVAKTQARAAWKKNKCVLAEVLPSLEQQKKLWKDTQFIPHPTTWINQRRWEDEVESPKQRSLPEAESFRAFLRETGSEYHSFPIECIPEYLVREFQQQSETF